MKERWTPAYDRLFDPDHELGMDEPACARWAWLDLCHMAQFRDGHRQVAGVRIFLRRGEFLTSVRFLANRWRWSKSRVGRFLKHLGTPPETRIGTVRGTRSGTVYRIVNYETYANPWDTERDSKRDGERDTKRDSRGTNNISSTTSTTSSLAPEIEAEILAVLGGDEIAVERLLTIPGIDPLDVRSFRARFINAPSVEKTWKGIGPEVQASLLAEAVHQFAAAKDPDGNPRKWKAMAFQNYLEVLAEGQRTGIKPQFDKAASAAGTPHWGYNL